MTLPKKDSEGAGRKGQLFTGDLAVAMFVFMVGLALAMVLWDDVTGELGGSEQRKEMESLAASTIENLVRTGGAPPDWNPYEVISPGLAASDRVLSSEKISNFIDLLNGSRYYENRGVLGLGGYEFYLNITDAAGDTISFAGKRAYAGLKPDGATSSLTTTRTATLDGETVKLIFTIWV